MAVRAAVILLVIENIGFTGLSLKNGLYLFLRKTQPLISYAVASKKQWSGEALRIQMQIIKFQLLCRLNLLGYLHKYLQNHGLVLLFYGWF